MFIQHQYTDQVYELLKVNEHLRQLIIWQDAGKPWSRKVEMMM